VFLSDLQIKKFKKVETRTFLFFNSNGATFEGVFAVLTVDSNGNFLIQDRQTRWLYVVNSAGKMLKIINVANIKFATVDFDGNIIATTYAYYTTQLRDIVVLSPDNLDS
jgi:hypothetical protein